MAITQSARARTADGATPAEVLIDLQGVTKTFISAGVSYTALHDVDLRLPRACLVALTGKSGSGKSTLLNMIAGIDSPTRGRVQVDGVALDRLTESALAVWRGRQVGVVFQFFQLLPTLTVLENVMLPMDFCAAYARGERRPRALALLDLVGIADQAQKLPSALSGGQQQRAAIARALANDPPVLLADEPTGNLDTQTAASVFQLLRTLARSGKSVVIATHEPEFAAGSDRAVVLSDGRVVEDRGTGAPAR